MKLEFYVLYLSVSLYILHYFFMIDGVFFKLTLTLSLMFLCGYRTDFYVAFPLKSVVFTITLSELLFHCLIDADKDAFRIILCFFHHE